MVLQAVLVVGGLGLVYLILTQTGLGRLTSTAADALDSVVNPEAGSYWDISGNLATVFGFGEDMDPFDVPLTEHEIALLEAQAAAQAEIDAAYVEGSGVGVRQASTITHKNQWYDGSWFETLGIEGPISGYMKEAWNNRNIGVTRDPDADQPFDSLTEAMAWTMGQIELSALNRDKVHPPHPTQMGERGFDGTGPKGPVAGRADVTNTAYGHHFPQQMWGKRFKSRRQVDGYWENYVNEDVFTNPKWGSNLWKMNDIQSRAWVAWLNEAVQKT